MNDEAPRSRCLHLSHLREQINLLLCWDSTSKQEAFLKRYGKVLTIQSIMRKETSQEHIVRTWKNTCVRVAGFCEKTGKLAKAQVKKSQLQREKKMFGIQYIDMVNNGCSDHDLHLFVESKRRELGGIQEQIDLFKAQVLSIEDRTKEKLVPKKFPPNEPAKWNEKDIAENNFFKTYLAKEQAAFASTSDRGFEDKDPLRFSPNSQKPAQGASIDESDYNIVTELEQEFVFLDDMEMPLSSAPPARVWMIGDTDCNLRLP